MLQAFGRSKTFVAVCPRVCKPPGFNCLNLRASMDSIACAEASSRWILSSQLTEGSHFIAANWMHARRPFLNAADMQATFGKLDLIPLQVASYGTGERGLPRAGATSRLQDFPLCEPPVASGRGFQPPFASFSAAQKTKIEGYGGCPAPAKKAHVTVLTRLSISVKVVIRAPRKILLAKSLRI
jgi:hypothetical protein